MPGAPFSFSLRHNSCLPIGKSIPRRYRSKLLGSMFLMKSMATALSAPLTPSSSSTVADALLGYQQGSASSAGKIRCCEETTDVRGARTLVAQNHSYLPSPVSPANRRKRRADERTRTADLEAHYECAVSGCSALPELAKPA